MKTVLPLLILMAAVFLICFLVDLLVKKLFSSRRFQTENPAVRPPRRSAVIGVLLLFVPIAVLLRLLPPEGSALITAGCVVMLLLGALLLGSYFSVTILYGEETFVWRRLFHGAQTFHYSQIRGQRSLMTRGGIQTILFVSDAQIPLYSAMQNLNPFLRTAFFKWCASKQIDPDSIPNNPQMFTWFPDPDGGTQESE